MILDSNSTASSTHFKSLLDRASHLNAAGTKARKLLVHALMDNSRHSQPQARPAARRYKSKHQRPCDFCRRRRSACRIEITGPPCGLCRAYGRECTFAEAPPLRSKPVAAAGDDRGDGETPTEIAVTSQNSSTIRPAVIVEVRNGEAYSAPGMNSAPDANLPFEASQDSMALANVCLHQMDPSRRDQGHDSTAQTGLMVNSEETSCVLGTDLNFEDMDFASALQYTNDLTQPQIHAGSSMLPSAVVGETDACKSC
jgi:hypothetical protein